MELDNEFYGNGNAYDFGARIYDSRLGRFFSVDPLAKKYPHLSSYHFVANSPIQNVELDGKEYAVYIDHNSRRITFSAKIVSITSNQIQEDFVKNTAEYWNNQSFKYVYIADGNEYDIVFDVKYEIVKPQINYPQEKYFLSLLTQDKSIHAPISSKFTLDESLNFMEFVSNYETEDVRNNVTRQTYGEAGFGNHFIPLNSLNSTLVGPHETGHGVFGLNHQKGPNLMNPILSNVSSELHLSSMNELFANTFCYSSKPLASNPQISTEGNEPKNFTSGSVSKADPSYVRSPNAGKSNAKTDFPTFSK